MNYTNPFGWGHKKPSSGFVLASRSLSRFYPWGPRRLDRMIAASWRPVTEAAPILMASVLLDSETSRCSLGVPGCCPVAILLLWSAFLHLHQPVALTILDLLSTHLSAGLCTRAAISGRMATSGGDVAFSLLALLRPVRRCHPIHLSVRGEPCSGSRSCRCSA